MGTTLKKGLQAERLFVPRGFRRDVSAALCVDGPTRLFFSYLLGFCPHQSFEENSTATVVADPCEIESSESPLEIRPTLLAYYSIG